MSFPYRDLSETGLIDLATEATHNFLNEGVPLNDSIEKLARQQDLTTHEIHRVVEESNKQAYLALRPKMAAAGTPVFEFDLADRDEILGRLQKVAEDTSRGCHDISCEVTDDRDEMDKVAAGFMALELGTPKQILERLLAEEQLEHDKIADDIFAIKAAIAGTCQEFVRTARDMVLQDGWSLDKLAAALCSARPDAEDLVEHLLADVAQMCRIKEAGPYHGPMNRSLTISGEPVLVINGTHKLVMDLDTLVEQTNDLEGSQQGLYRVDDTIAYLRKNVRNFTSREIAKPPHVFGRVKREPDRDLLELGYGK